MHMMIWIARRVRLGSERGFSLTELLVAIPIAVVLLTAVFTMMRASARHSVNVTERTEATQRGRTAMERVTRQLHSQVCPTTTGTALTTADANTVTFYTDMSGGASQPEQHTITYDPTAQTLTQYEYAGSSGTWPSIVYPASPTRTRQILNNVTAVSGVPFFRYYQYAANGTVSPTAMTTPVSQANLPRVVNVAVSFVSKPRKANASSPTTTFQGEASMRTSDPNNPTQNARCL
jgi:prepilin-type N-terminal cleavage/methylation domain-containing protein